MGRAVAIGSIHYGVLKPLEDEADRIIAQSLVGVTSQEAKKDILTPWKEKDRRDREVYTEEGVPDGSVRRGVFARAWNPAMPHLNSRDGLSRSHRINSSLEQHAEDHGSGSFRPEASD